MAKAKQVAAALRTIAENLEREPEAEVGGYFCSAYPVTKEHTLNLCRLMPRPYVKDYSRADEIELYHDFMASSTPHDYSVRARITIKRAHVCELVEPAKPAVYRCNPLLSDEEEAAL
jgi:hypothetical protein